MLVEADTMDWSEYERRTDPVLAVEQAEQSALGGQLVFADLLGAPWMPAPSDYSVPAHQLIASAISACLPAGAVDPLAVFTWLSDRDEVDAAGGLSYINGLAQGVPSQAAIKTHAAIVRKKAQTRRESALRAQAAALLGGSSETADVLPEVRALLDRVDGHAPITGAAGPRTLAFDQLAPNRAPPRHWFRGGWLGAGVTLFPGKGGEGKSTLAQHEATCGSLGRSYFAGESEPYRSLLWNCEDEHDDVWRRQEQICDHERLEMASLVDRLFLVSRYGCDNALMVENHGALVPTRLLEELRQQVNDLAIDVLWLDNAAHLLVGNHDDRTHATQFINMLNSLVVGRPFGVVLLAHVSRAQGSEYSGSAAWENAARMRWYLGAKLPDQTFDATEEAGPTDVRYLCKRKSNYSARDYAKFTMRAGLMVPEHVDGDRIGGLVNALADEQAEQHCIAGFHALTSLGILPSDKPNSGDYLPRQIVEKGLAPGFTKHDLARALNRLMGRGQFVRGVVGRYSNSNPKHGLQLVETTK
jgi:hypothetical protein